MSALNNRIYYLMDKHTMDKNAIESKKEQDIIDKNKMSVRIPGASGNLYILVDKDIDKEHLDELIKKHQKLCK